MAWRFETVKGYAAHEVPQNLFPICETLKYRNPSILPIKYNELINSFKGEKGVIHMNKNSISILLVGIIFLGLVLSNLYFVKNTFELNEQLTRIYELENTINELKAENQRKLDELRADYEKQIEIINKAYSEKVDTVTKALNAFEYELEEFYRNKFIMKEDYLENIKKINDVRAKLEEDSN